MGAPPRILVFVVAYDAEKHIRSVFERIPAELFDDERVSFLCIDDASSDTGASLLVEWLRERDVRNVVVLRNPVNQGYGGNQKLGYRFAINSGADLVILLHGDGQYAPELLPRFIATFEETRADVIVGSRMSLPGGARRGGMPLYKRVGNRTLSWVQNRLTGLRLSEYHSGYRAYSTAFLERIPFEIDTNDFHFDTEILLQADYVGARVVEFPIPTHYGDEICHVAGFRYAGRVLGATLQYRMHRLGMLCSLKYRHLRSERYVDKTEHPYSSHARALERVIDLGPATVLDIGCGHGWVAEKLTASGMSVVGIDRRDPGPDSSMTEFHRTDLDRDEIPVDPFAYDVILALDVVEHLADPEGFLLRLRNSSQALRPAAPAPVMLVSTPNIAFFAIRVNLLLGRFSYAERGILDITHKRLFTRSSFRTTLRDCGYEIEEVIPIPVPFGATVGGRLGSVLERVADMFARAWPTMFAFQFLAVCRPRPGIANILAAGEVGWVGPRARAANTRGNGAS